MAALELEHRCALDLVTRGSSQVLLHAVTGELKSLTGGPYDLQLDEEGVGFLTSGSSTEIIWVSDLLTMKCFRSPREGFGQECPS